MIYLSLFYEFFKIGLFAVGGGQATIPFLIELSEKTNWFSLYDLSDMIAVAESTPGPIGINASTYVGIKVGGLFGGLCATIGIVMPSFIIIIIISKILLKFKDSPYVNGMFKCIRPLSSALIANSLYALGQMTFTDLSAATLYKILLAVVIFVASNFIPKVKEMHPIIFILFAAVVGIVLEL